MFVFLLALSLNSMGQSPPPPARSVDSGALVLLVRDPQGAPVVAANVQVAGRMAQTNVQGRVELALPQGRHAMTITAAGFQVLTLPVDVTAVAETLIEANLLPQVSIQEEIIVTAARSDRRLEDLPVRVEVVDREEIEEKALMTPGSIAMLLGETTGLRVQTTAPSIGAANVRIQGLRGRYSQLLSDGLPLYGLQGDALSLMQVPPLDVEQVEIIKGAASALYGPSALGGSSTWSPGGRL